MEHEEIICRCEEITKAEIIKAIEEGAQSLEDIKKMTRAGMGYCQGRTCKKLTARILSIYTEKSMGSYMPGSIRMPIGTVTLGELAGMMDGTEEQE